MKTTENNLAPVVDRETDIDIPRRVWSAWVPAEGKRALIRPLSDEERAKLEKRARELTLAFAPWVPEDVDEIVLAVTDMFGAFPAMKSQGHADAVGKIDAVLRALAPFPLWAILRACAEIRSEGYIVDEAGGSTRREKHWPPSDPDVVAQVRREMRVRVKALEEALQLLAAPVEERTA